MTNGIRLLRNADVQIRPLPPIRRSETPARYRCTGRNIIPRIPNRQYLGFKLAVLAKPLRIRAGTSDLIPQHDATSSRSYG